MTDYDSGGAKAMRALARRIKDYAAELGHDPARQHDLRQAAELLLHLEKLTTKLARPAQAPRWDRDGDDLRVCRPSTRAMNVHCRGGIADEDDCEMRRPGAGDNNVESGLSVEEREKMLYHREPLLEPGGEQRKLIDNVIERDIWLPDDAPEELKLAKAGRHQYRDLLEQLVESALKDGMPLRDAVFHAASVMREIRVGATAYDDDQRRQLNFWKHVNDAAHRIRKKDFPQLYRSNVGISQVADPSPTGR